MFPVPAAFPVGPRSAALSMKRHQPENQRGREDKGTGDIGRDFPREWGLPEAEVAEIGVSETGK